MLYRDPPPPASAVVSCLSGFFALDLAPLPLGKLLVLVVLLVSRGLNLIVIVTARQHGRDAYCGFGEASCIENKSHIHAPYKSKGQLAHPLLPTIGLRAWCIEK